MTCETLQVLYGIVKVILWISLPTIIGLACAWMREKYGWFKRVAQ